MQEVGEVSTQTSAANRQTAVAIKRLSETSEQLAISVETFKLDDSANPQTEQAADA
jgi:hypothetical protein